MPKQPYRQPTARFTTKECKILLKALIAAIESGGMLFVDLDEMGKIEAKLKYRIAAEEANENRTGDRSRDQETGSASTVSG